MHVGLKYLMFDEGFTKENRGLPKESKFPRVNFTFRLWQSGAGFLGFGNWVIDFTLRLKGN